MVLVWLVVLVPACSAGDGPVPVEVVVHKGKHELRRSGEPYFIRGVGGSSRLERLAQAGGNSVRTWDAEGMGDFLDKAHSLGLTVTLGLWLEHPRHGFDPSDKAAREAQLERIGGFVRAFRDHPAVLMWGVGNEVELEADLTEALGIVEEAAAHVKALDPNHPTMAVIAEIGGGKARAMQDQCPSVDIIGINSYAGMASIPERLDEQGVTKPYVITEFGPPGHWEVGKAPWGAPFEPSSAEKVAAYTNSYRSGVLAERGKRCLGSYAFLWGHKQETTGTWFGMFLPTGESTPTVDAMTKLWGGDRPANRAPVVERIVLDGEGLEFVPGHALGARVVVRDPDRDDLTIDWELRAESTDRRTGGDHEAVPDVIPIEVDSANERGAKVVLPTKPGAYRLFVVVRDGHGNAGTANLPLLVRDR